MKTILDVCCGGRMFWFDKSNPAVLFGDIRNETNDLGGERAPHVICPDVQMDFRSLPLPNNQFSLVVYDPPHMARLGKNSWMAKKYGVLFPTWQHDIREGFTECVRVLKIGGTLIFKWSEAEISLVAVLDAVCLTKKQSSLY